MIPHACFKPRVRRLPNGMYRLRPPVGAPGKSQAYLSLSVPAALEHWRRDEVERVAAGLGRDDWARVAICFDQLRNYYGFPI
jgi:hypothetical protein